MNQADRRGSGRGRQATESLPNEAAFPCETKDVGQTDEGLRRICPRHDGTVLSLTCSGASCWRVPGYFVASSLLSGFPPRALRAPQLICLERPPTLTGP